MYYLPYCPEGGDADTLLVFRRRGCGFDLQVGSVSSLASHGVPGLSGRALACSVVPGPELLARTFAGENHAVIPARIHSECSGPVFEMNLVLFADLRYSGWTSLFYWSLLVAKHGIMCIQTPNFKKGCTCIKFGPEEVSQQGSLWLRALECDGIAELYNKAFTLISC